MKNKGSISLFMAIIMLSMFIMSSILVDGARIRNSKTVLQEAVDSAALSVLAKYDKQLKQRYGLFVLEEESVDAIQEDFYGFLLENISSQLPTQNNFKEFVNTILGNFSNGMNLYDFNIEENGFNVDKMYSIIEPEVFKSQIAEFSKYRSALVLDEFFDLSKKIKELVETNKKDIHNIKSTLELRQRMQDISEDFSKIKEKMIYTSEEFNKLNQDYKPMMKEILDSLKEYSELCDEVSELSEILYDLEEDNEKGQNDEQIEELSKEIEELNKKIEELVNELKSKEPEIYSWAVLVEDFENEFAEQRKICIEALERANLLYNDIFEYIKEIDSNNGNVEDQIIKDLQIYLEQLKKIKECGLNEWFDVTIEYLKALVQSLTDMSTDIINSSGADESICIPNSDKYPEFEYIIGEKHWESVKILWDFYKIKKDKKDEKSKSNIEISENTFNRLPSQIYSNYETSDKYSEEDTQYIKEMIENGEIYDISSSGKYENINFTEYEFEEFDEMAYDRDSIDKNFEVMENILDGLSNMANNTLTSAMSDFYIMGMMKTRLTKSTSQWQEIYKNKKFDNSEEFYISRDKEEEKNLLFENKGNYTVEKGNNFFNSEIEYILEGELKECDNENRIYAKIYAMRLVNNWIAVYTNQELRDISQGAALILAAFTFGALAPIAEIAIITALAAVETALDMYFLINMGYQIPFIKTNQNININVNNLAKVYKNIAVDGEIEPICNGTFNIKYENYLYFFLLLTNRDNKLLRTADIIQLNMSKLKYSSYALAEHYTYIRYDTLTTIKPLFISSMFVPENIRNNERFKIRSLGYKGY